MRIKIEYLNKDKEERCLDYILESLDDCELLGVDLRTVLEIGATDVKVYKI